MINNIREYGVFTPYSLIFKNHINLKKYYSMGLFRKTGQTFISWVGGGKMGNWLFFYDTRRPRI